MADPTPAQIEAAARAEAERRFTPERYALSHTYRREDYVAGALFGAALTAAAQVQPAETITNAVTGETRTYGGGCAVLGCTTYPACAHPHTGLAQPEPSGVGPGAMIPPPWTQPAPEADERAGLVATHWDDVGRPVVWETADWASHRAGPTNLRGGRVIVPDHYGDGAMEVLYRESVPAAPLTLSTTGHWSIDMKVETLLDAIVTAGGPDLRRSQPAPPSCDHYSVPGQCDATGCPHNPEWTEEALDALPEGTIVRDGDSLVAVRYSNGWGIVGSEVIHTSADVIYASIDPPIRVVLARRSQPAP